LGSGFPDPIIEVTPAIQLRDDEVAWKAVRASGPGGQHVKTVYPTGRA
jgi:protein subunit release factor B